MFKQITDFMENFFQSFNVALEKATTRSNILLR